MACSGCRLSMFVLWLVGAAMPGQGIAGEAWQQQIADLEARLFDPILSAGEVDRLLGELEHAATRPEAARRLAGQGQGHVDRVIAFARHCPDMEARQACVEIVEALDASYRTTELGERLGALYREHAEALLPAYWARFRNDPLDPRAVAMLMHADAAATYAALGRTGDRHDPLRYLLLRIRELSPDEFAQEHIFEHSEGGARLVMADVFPTAGYRRIVGQVGLMRMKVGRSHVPGAGLPKIGYLSVYKRSVFIYAHPAPRLKDLSLQAAILVDTLHGYNPKEIGQTSTKRDLGPVPEQIFLLPQLNPSGDPQLAWLCDNVAPWWAEPHVPPAYRERIRFGAQPPGAVPPEATREEPIREPLAPKAAVAVGEVAPLALSVVVLPPRFLSVASPQVRAAAELACDRLAQEITAAGLAHVVDRQQLDGLLQERELAAGRPEPMLSFDVMLRLEVDGPALAPTARLSFIDLSHGNPLSEAEYDWPLREADVPALVRQCREAFEQASRPKDNALKVRYLGAVNPQQNRRIAPLVARLSRVFEQSVARSPELVRVHRLEAASAKEESLLLLMGLSRLPGGRQFVPQADATIELRVFEGDGLGKTFEQTPVEITVDVAPAAGERQSLLIVGTVGEFDDAAARAWDKLAGVLREARPAAAAEWLGDMASRRRQAEAELRAARAIAHRTAYRNDSTDDTQARLAKLAHAEAALKLDPALEDAAYHYLVALNRVHMARAFGRAPGQAAELAERILTHALGYLNRSDTDADRRSHVAGICIGTIRASMGHSFAPNTPLATPRGLRMIRQARTVLEYSMEHHGPYHTDALALLDLGRAMRRAGIPEDEREAWVDSLLELCVRFEAAFPERDQTWRYHAQGGNLIWLSAAELAVEDGKMARAQTLIAERWPRFADGSARYIVFGRVRNVLIKMDAGAELDEFERWVEALNVPGVRIKELRWPAVEVFPGERQWPRDSSNPMPGVDGEWVRFRSQVYEGSFAPVSSLIEAEGRLYLIGGSGATSPHFRATDGERQWRRIGYVSLNDAGGPIGELQHAIRSGRDELWYAPTWLPPPDVARALDVLSATSIDGRLVLGTERAGLMVFDPKTEQWSNVAAEHGLPAETVVAVHPLDHRSLLCVGLVYRRVPVVYTVTLPEGTVTLRHRLRGEGMEAAPRMLWRDGEALRAWTERGLYDDLLAEHPAFKQRGWAVPYGWNCPGGTVRHDRFTSFAEVNGRRFVTNAGVHEIDSNGAFLRSYRGTNSYWVPSEPSFSISLPADAPIASDQMVAAGSLLVFIDRDCVLGWDPGTDTWYGPLAVHGMRHALGTRAGLWLGTYRGLMFLSPDNLMATAKAAGRALSTGQYRRRQREAVAAMPPVDRAKVAYSVRRFDEAKELGEAVLRDDPQCADTLLLLGYLHEPSALNRPEQAIEYYGRLAELDADPNASFTGMYRRLILLRGRKQWPEVLAAIDDLTAAFPRLGESRRKTIDGWRDHAREQLAAPDANQPPAGNGKGR